MISSYFGANFADSPCILSLLTPYTRQQPSARARGALIVQTMLTVVTQMA
jgi:hypothetical protein